MLTLLTGGQSKDCEGHTRREMLQVGALGLGGMTLPGLLATKAHASELGIGVKDKAVVVLFLQGGPTHIETFDPKMTAPSEYRAMFGEVKTNLPGVTFGSHFKRLAGMADKLAVVRSYRHGNGSHASASHHVASGGNATGACMGSLYSRVVGISNPKTGLPLHSIVRPPAIDAKKYKTIGGPADRVTQIGDLPPAFKAFDPSSGGQVIENMKLRVAQNRLGDRKSLLKKLDGIKREIDQTGALDGADRFQQQAVDVILGGVADAFNLSKEDKATVARYDTSEFDIPKWLYKKKNKNLLRQSPVSLGKQMLMARRLVEYGAGFVTVTSAGWDMHGNAFGVDDGMPLLGPAVDKAVSAFIEDLAARGLSEKVLLVVTGEFGRTPKINKKGGRDHWGNLCTLAFSGGGLNMGQVIGESDRTASVPKKDPVSTRQVLATVMHTLFDLGELRLRQDIPRDVYAAIDAGAPIPNLM